MREHRTKSGKTIYFKARSELEGLHGYPAFGGGRRALACCPVQGGDNPTELSIDCDTGWASC